MAAPPPKPVVPVPGNTVTTLTSSGLLAAYDQGATKFILPANIPGLSGGAGLAAPASANTLTALAASALLVTYQNGAVAYMTPNSFLADVGQTVAQGAAAGTVSLTDAFYLNQGGASDVVVTMQQVGLAVLSSQLSTVQIVSSTTLNAATHHNRRLVCVSSGLTIAAPSSPVLPDGFQCEIYNAAGAGNALTLGSGITSPSGVTTLPNGGLVDLFATTAIGGGGTLSVLATFFSGGVAAVAPGAPGTPAASAIGTTSLTLSWAAPGSGGAASSYLVQYSPTGANNWTTFATQPTSPSVIVTGLTVSTAYDFRVAAQNSGGTSAYSTVLSNVSTTATLSAPGAVTGLAATSEAATSITLSWAAGSGGPASAWAVKQRTPSGSGSYVASAGSFSATGGTVTGLTAGSTYDFQVVPSNSAGTGAAATLTGTSTTVAAPGAVTSLAAGTITTTSVVLSWAAGSGGTATSWTVKQRTPSGSGTYAASAGTFSATGGTVTGLAASTTYDFEVAATNAGGTSAQAVLTAVSTSAPAAIAYQFFGDTLGFGGVTSSGNISTNGYVGTVAALDVKIGGSMVSSPYTGADGNPLVINVTWSKSSTVSPFPANYAFLAASSSGNINNNQDCTGLEEGTGQYAGAFHNPSGLYAWGSAGSYYLWIRTSDGQTHVYDNGTGTPVASTFT